MKVLNKNQIIILVIALMLVSAGYLNYTSIQNENTIATSIGENGIDYAGIGDAKLVSSNGIIESNEEVALVPNNEILEDLAISEENKNEIETVVTNSNTTSEDIKEYFSSSRLID